MNYYLTQFKNNWKSGLSVALVSVPLSLSLSIASGAGPLPGIITAIWAGLIASIFGGSHYNIVGPAGALSSILAAYALTYGPAVLSQIAIIAGIMGLIAWAFRLDKYLIFIPSAVVHGFTLGVAITIAAGQLNFAFGLQNLPKHKELIQNIFETIKHLGVASIATTATFAIGISLMFLLLKKAPKLPSTIIIALIGVVMGALMEKGIIPFHILTLKDVYGTLSLHLVSFPHLDKTIFNPEIIKGGAVVAFVAVLETLISGKIADGMTKTKFSERKEVFGVSLANIAAGLTGGIPASGVFARTAINVKTGATSRYSQMINAVAVAIIALILIPWFSYIPLSLVASILVYAAIRMVGREHFKKIYAHDKTSFWISIAVAALVVVYDATTGILVGALVSLILFAHRLSHAQSLVTAHAEDATLKGYVNEEMQGDTFVYRFAGELTYVNAKSHIAAMSRISKDAKSVVLNLKNLFYIDTDGIEALEEIVRDVEQKHLHVFITGAHKVLMPVLESQHWFTKLEKDGRVLGTSYEAVNKALSLKTIKQNPTTQVI